MQVVVTPDGRKPGLKWRISQCESRCVSRVYWDKELFPVARTQGVFTIRKSNLFGDEEGAGFGGRGCDSLRRVLERVFRVRRK